MNVVSDNPELSYAGAFGAMWTVAAIAAQKLEWAVKDLDWIIQYIRTHEEHTHTEYRDHELVRLGNLRELLVREVDYLHEKCKEYPLRDEVIAPLPPVDEKFKEPAF